MSTPNYRYFHRDHMLSCRPYQQDDGRWQARVAIVAMGGLKTQAQRFLDLDSFDGHDEAVAFAHASGIAWVDKHFPVEKPRNPGRCVGPA